MLSSPDYLSGYEAGLLDSLLPRQKSKGTRVGETRGQQPEREMAKRPSTLRDYFGAGPPPKQSKSSGDETGAAGAGSTTASEIAHSESESGTSGTPTNTTGHSETCGSRETESGHGQASSSSSSTSTCNDITTDSEQSSIPADIASGPHQLPVQPVISFPSGTFGSKKRAFNSEWYKLYPWLEYSQEKDAGYCYPCRLFRVSGSGKSDAAFTRNGYRDWKHAC